MFSLYKSHNNNLYNKLVELSRNIFFYKVLGLKDNFETRVFLMFIHFSIILLIYKNKANKKFPQEIFDNIFTNIEYHMREMGLGDVAVNTKMKTLNKLFYDILLKLNTSKNNDFLPNKNLIIKYFNELSGSNDDKMKKMTDYLQNFHNFCFELEDKIMIKGQINYKY